MGPDWKICIGLAGSASLHTNALFDAGKNAEILKHFEYDTGTGMNVELVVFKCLDDDGNPSLAPPISSKASDTPTPPQLTDITAVWCLVRMTSYDGTGGWMI
ncbi:LOW QUALITY PROTEIN: hypothetical protein H101_04242 [Trichophyton interdigitale H6]|nr:LOW QUALITY PROTEIN: hypothetical protein H101_04242 [Trichophyton interdigitale H6]